MSDLIDRQAAIEEIQNVRYRLADMTMLMINAVKRVPSAQPTADVVEREKGKWSHDGSKWANRFICSECGYKLFDEPTNFCPNCGADMRERREDAVH